MKLDLIDWIIIFGLCLIWIGCFMLSVPWSFVTVGVIILLLGLRAAVLKGGDTKE